MRKRLHLQAGLIALALILLMHGELRAQRGGVLEYGATVNGSTASAGTENWTFFGNEGDLVVISMNSDEFDTYLELRGPDGALLVSDDDGGDDLNSRIIRALPETGQYTITAGGFGSERGAYSLSLAVEPGFNELVRSALAQLNIIPGNGYVAEGAYQIIIDLTEEDETVQWQGLDGEYTDFVMGADINWGPGATEDTCGFIFRQVDNDNYYIVEIDRNGAVWFAERDEGGWGETEGGNYLAVRTGAKDTNRLVLSVTGDTFIVYVNGQRTATFNDTSNISGAVAVEMSTFDESAVTNCTFTNVWVWQPASLNPTSTPQALPTLPGAATPLPTLPGPGVLPTKTPISGGGVTTTAATVTINVPSANLRSGPSTDFPRVASAAQGDTFNVIGRAGSGLDLWYLVSLPDGQQGWLWSGIVTLSPANASIPVVDNAPVTSRNPVINSIISQGTCANLTLVVNWSDPNGDAVRIEWLDTDTSAVAFTDNISGSGGSFSSTGWYCESESCVTNARIVDAEGNVSNIYQATTTCP